jgi:hypothetical protein
MVKENKPQNTDEAGKFGPVIIKTNFSSYQNRIQLAIDQLVKAGANPDEIAVIDIALAELVLLKLPRGGQK